MWFFTLVSWVSCTIQIIFATLAIASGLYYLAELVEEYTHTAAKVIKYMILFVLTIHIGFVAFEDLPLLMNVVGIATQILYLCLLASFPVVMLTSPSFIAGICLLIIHHYLAFKHFGERFYNFSEVLSYFVICLWLVPFSFFISLSANDNTLPMTVPSQSSKYGNTNDQQVFNVDGDVVSNYFSTKKGKRYGLLSLFNYFKDLLAPERSKRYT